MNNSNESKKRELKSYLPKALSAFLILTGILYIIAVCHLYFTGGNTPYTRERVGEHLLWLLAPSLITVILAIAAAFACRGERDKQQNAESISVEIFKNRSALKRLTLGFDCENSSYKAKKKIEGLRALRRDSLIISLAVTALVLIPIFVTLLDTDRFTIEGVNSDIALASLTVILNIAIAFAVWCSHSFTVAYSEKEEIAAIKDAIRENPALYKNIKPTDEAKKEERLLLGVRIAALAVAAALIILGISNGGMADVLAKAVKICTECIVLG